MVVTEAPLVQVKTITRKHVLQIVLLHYDMAAGSKWRQLIGLIKSNSAAVKRLGWISSDVVGDIGLKNEFGNSEYSAARFLHLVEWDGQLFWMPCPDRWNSTSDDAGPQLFY